ncbi:MAG: proton-conducting transporter membrane subunit, partial [Myxococcota bacterium]
MAKSLETVRRSRKEDATPMIAFLPLIALVYPACLIAIWLGSMLRPGRPPRALKKATAAASYVGIAVAVVLSGVVATYGAMTSPLLGMEELGASVRLDALSVVIFSMVALLAVVILRFSRTYLEGDARQGVFIGRMALTIATVQVLVVSGNLALFVAAWIATSLSLHTLLVFYADRPAAVAAAKKKFIAARIGDVCLIVAAALLYGQFGTGDLGTIFSKASEVSSNLQLEIATGLLAIASLFKSAQFPTHGWLVEVMETPTPVSALLHAGILNAGPFLIIRFASVMTLSTSAAVCLIVMGGFTALFASIVLLTQPSVKVALGYSSAAHMGFMLFVCGLGVYPAAVLHLVAHSFYKAHAFLSSGSVVDVARAKAVRVPGRLRSPLRALASVAVATGIYWGTATLLGFTPTENVALLAVGAILVMGLTQLLVPALDSAGTAQGMARTTGLAVMVTLAFFSLEEGAHRLLVDSLPATTHPDLVIMALAGVV